MIKMLKVLNVEIVKWVDLKEESRVKNELKRKVSQKTGTKEIKTLLNIFI